MSETTHYSTMPSPVGELLLLGGEAGLTGVYMQQHLHWDGPRPHWRRDDQQLRQARAQLRAYFAEEVRTFDLPLALPVIVTGIRIVLVQAIGLVTIAALIGGGGFGIFIFQGIGQTAMDLVMLGAVPTVFFAFSSAVILDAVIDSIRGSAA